MNPRRPAPRTGAARRPGAPAASPAAPSPSATAGRDRVIFLIAAIYLIGTFLYRALTPAHEGALRGELILTMALDALCVVALVVMKRKVQGGGVLFWIALAAGVGLFAIRLSSDEGWWTGHIFFTLEPR